MANLEDNSDVVMAWFGRPRGIGSSAGPARRTLPFIKKNILLVL